MERIRGPDGSTESMFTVLKLDDFVPKDHPLRPICTWLNDALKRMDDVFARMYEADTKGGRPGIAAEKLVRALLLQVLYPIRSERLLMEPISYACCSAGSWACRLTEPFGTNRRLARTATNCSNEGCGSARFINSRARQCMGNFFDTQEPTMNVHDVVVAGGGISGLYCAWRLAEAGQQVLVLEASLDRWGGRIETEEMDGFVAEYGPMRFEPTLQPRFSNLCRELGVHLTQFCGPEGEEGNAPSYDLPHEEIGLNSLQLLKRGIMLVMGRDPADQAWIDQLTEADYQRIRKHAQFDGKPLWNMGFWNALSSEGVMSHLALTKLRDTGTFYHMIPENLNAAEWIIWWLRALKTVGQQLASVDGGTGKLTDGLVARLQKHPNVTLAGGHALVGFRPLALGQNRVELDVQTRRGVVTLGTDRLILAMPRLPLVNLARSLPAHVASHLDSVNGFPMLKVFFVTDTPWWNYDQRPQQYASCLPTRELHYFRRPKDADYDGHGMVLLYMDRPATEFWKHYLIKPDQHDRAEIDHNVDIVDAFSLFVARDIKRLIDLDQSSFRLTERARRMFNEETLDQARTHIKESVVTYGIRDWARAPYGAANHGWQPGVRSWKVMDLFKGFDFGNGAKNIHIVGEAYSNYQGFIEGALNTTESALELILAGLTMAGKSPSVSGSDVSENRGASEQS